MDIAFDAKILCDLSLWFCTTSFIYSFFSRTAISLWPAGLMLLCCAACSGLKSKTPPLRLIPLLALAACGFWLHGAADVLLLLPPCLYCAWLCVRGLFSPDYSSSCTTFKASVVILTLFLLIAAICGGGPRIEKFSLLYFFSFLFSGIAMLRLLRHDEQTRKEWRLWLVSLISLILCCAAALFLSSELFLHSAGAALGALYRYIIQPLLMGIIYLVTAVIWLIEQVIGLFRPENHAAEIKPQDLLDSMNLGVTGNTDGSGNEIVKKILLALAIVIAAAVFIVLAFTLFRRLAEGAGETQEGPEIQSKREPVINRGGHRPAARAILTPRTPRETVRWFYRKFLLRAQSGGMELRLSDTSESIAHAAGNLYEPALVSELREIYIIARYSPDSVTSGDVKRVREIYGKLKRERRS